MEMQGFNVAERTNIHFCGNDYVKAVTNSSAIVICTEWDEYATCNYRHFKELMKQDENVHVFDFRSIIDPELIRAAAEGIRFGFRRHHV